MATSIDNVYIDNTNYHILPGVKGYTSSNIAESTKILSTVYPGSSDGGIYFDNNPPTRFILPVRFFYGNSAVGQVSIQSSSGTFGSVYTWYGKLPVLPRYSGDNVATYCTVWIMFDSSNGTSSGEFYCLDLMGSDSVGKSSETGTGNSTQSITDDYIYKVYPRFLTTHHLLAKPTTKISARSSDTVMTDVQAKLTDVFSGMSTTSTLYKMAPYYYPICISDWRQQDFQCQFRTLYISGCEGGIATFTVAPHNPSNTTSDGTDQNLTCRILWEYMY